MLLSIDPMCRALKNNQISSKVSKKKLLWQPNNIKALSLIYREEKKLNRIKAEADLLREKINLQLKMK
jgi:hypothetical protein